MQALSSIFQQLLAPYCKDETLVKQLYSDIETHYNAKSRHYHTLQHLQNMYGQLLLVKDKTDDWETLLFSLFYHDIIYSATAKDNEEKSVDFADNALRQIAYPDAKMQRCQQQILATKSHSLSADEDTNYFTDADLSILGASWPDYSAYTQAIRKEYAIYPDLLYKPGRRNVLQHFLGIETIFKTAYFQNLYNSTAQENLNKELETLF